MCLYTAWKVSKYGVFSGPYFPANSVFGHILHSDSVAKKSVPSLLLCRHEKLYFSDVFGKSSLFPRNIFSVLIATIVLPIPVKHVLALLQVSNFKYSARKKKTPRKNPCDIFLFDDKIEAVSLQFYQKKKPTSVQVFFRGILPKVLEKLSFRKLVSICFNFSTCWSFSCNISTTFSILGYQEHSRRTNKWRCCQSRWYLHSHFVICVKSNDRKTRYLRKTIPVPAERNDP